MGMTPVAAPHTEGRIFGVDWSIANVAKLLRSNAGRGMWRQQGATGGSNAKVNQYYMRTVSAQHLRTHVSLIFMQLDTEKCWYTSLCFAEGDDYLPWNQPIAEQWLWALFGEDRPRVLEEPAAVDAPNQSVRQFRLAMR